MPNYIDLFCGAGGFSKGFDEEGFKNIFQMTVIKIFVKHTEKISLNIN